MPKLSVHILVNAVTLVFLLLRGSTAAQDVDTTNTIGVLVYADSTDSRDSIRFYNADGTLWYLFSFYYDDRDGVWDFPNDGFRPLAFHPDYILLRLAVTGQDTLGYEVIVNKDTGLRKRLARRPFLQFRTWAEHVRSVFAVQFDSASNPIRVAPSDTASALPFPGKSTPYRPAETKGEWMRVRWGDRGSGWIRWRRGARLQVRCFYFA
jgi:hypothetical protein